MGDDLDNSEAGKLPKKIFVFFVLIIILFIFGAMGFVIVEGVSFKEGFILTIESLSFVFPDFSVFSKFFGFSLSIVGLFLIWWVLWTFADLVFEGDITQYLKARFYNLKIKKMKDHYIIVGGGRVGEEIARNLDHLKRKFLIIEKDPAKVIKLKKKKYLVIQGDANDIESRVLDKANIKEARVVVIAMPETEKNLLLTLIVKEIKPEIEIYARSDHAEFVSRLKKAGAKSVIVPEIVAADKFIQEMLK